MRAIVWIINVQYDMIVARVQTTDTECARYPDPSDQPTDSASSIAPRNDGVVGVDGAHDRPRVVREVLPCGHVSVIRDRRGIRAGCHACSVAGNYEKVI